MQHPDLRVSSEEKVLDAVLLWGANSDGLSGWEDADALLSEREKKTFSEREEELKCLLPLVRFPFMPIPVLRKVSFTAFVLSVV